MVTLNNVTFSLFTCTSYSRLPAMILLQLTNLVKASLLVFLVSYQATQGFALEDFYQNEPLALPVGATSEPEPTSEPTGEPEPTPMPTGEPEPTPEPTGEPEPVSEPIGEPKPSNEPEPTNEPASEPEPNNEPVGEPEPDTLPEPEPSDEPPAFSEQRPSNAALLLPPFLLMAIIIAGR